VQSELRQPELAFVCAASERAEAALSTVRAHATPHACQPAQTRTCARPLRCLSLSGESKRKALLALRPMPGTPSMRGALARLGVGTAGEAKAAWRPRQATGGGVLQRADGRATRQRAPSHAVGNAQPPGSAAAPACSSR
jgi:hypothetical protein